MARSETKRTFTDRESGTYAGLIIDMLDTEQQMDNAIAHGFRKHNVIELKNPVEVDGVLQRGYRQTGRRGRSPG